MKISSKLIKPHIPTPQDLKNYKISFTDSHQHSVNLGVILFYESKPDDERQLEDSLAKVLVDFYPLAGRYLKNDLLIDCSDQGAEFVEAEVVDVELIAKIETEQQLNDLLPDQYFRLDEAGHDPLLSIKATHFRRGGGVAIAVSVSHIVFDVSSLGTFIAAWSSACSNPDRMIGLPSLTPSFHLPSLLPSKVGDFSIDSEANHSSEKEKTVVVRRLLFNKVGLTSLKSRTKGKTVSGVRVVTAIIAKALINVDRIEHGKSRDLVICQPVNMRERTIPSQPQQACGNFSFPAFTRRVAATEVGEMGIEELADLIGDSIRKSIADHAEILSPEIDGRDIIGNVLKKAIGEAGKPETNFLFFSDWSKFGFHEANFGWGKPIWTTTGPQSHSRGTILMSNKEGDGIEAWVYLTKNDMSCFEQDEDIKCFLL